MKILRRVLLVVAAAVVLLQFYRPDRTAGPTDTDESILKTFPVSAEAEAMLRRSCYDCHSNATRYPWYTNIQPVGHWMQGHIDDARRHLNFDQFRSYPLTRQYQKFQEIESEVRDELMPLPAYLPMHSEARLTPEDRTFLVHWAQDMRDSMKAWYPLDSLMRRRPRR